MNAFKGLGNQLDKLNTISGGVVMTSMDLLQNQEGFVANVSTPTLGEENYHIEVQNNQLRLFVFLNHSLYASDTNAKVPAFFRVFPIPPFVDGEKIEAVFENNELKIYAPFKEGFDGDARNINIKRFKD